MDDFELALGQAALSPRETWFEINKELRAHSREMERTDRAGQTRGIFSCMEYGEITPEAQNLLDSLGIQLEGDYLLVPN